MTMLRILALFSLAVYSNSFVWERTKIRGFTHQSRFQHVPKQRVTAKKIERFFIRSDNDLRKRSRRDIEDNHTRYDVVLIFDSSNSIRRRDFYRGVKALEVIIDKAQPDTHYAAITFSQKATISFDFTDYETAKQYLHSRVRFIGHNTNTQEALQKCRTELFQKGNSKLRPGARKRVLLLSDGSSNMNVHLTLYRALQLKMIGVEVFVIGVGNYMTGIQELVGIASSTNKHLFRVVNTMSLLQIARLIPPWRYIDQVQPPWVKEKFLQAELYGDEINN
ncbi:integrin alpha-1-like [Acropora palmata]|uniref:integrin alpha-1-like n=1 Tax=Acropora palmata TaxID=6131 RepID=UPI003DA0A300